jgi:hypothetical protein
LACIWDDGEVKPVCCFIPAGVKMACAERGVIVYESERVR